MDMRMTCLAHAKLELEAVTDCLLTLDAGEAQRVPELLDGLPALARCSDLAALEADVPPPAPAIAADVAELREAIAHAAAARRLGKTEAADTLAALHVRALAIDYPPLHTEALVELGEAERFAGHPDQARVHLDEALRLALANQQPTLAIEALSLLTAVAGVDLQQPQQATIYASVSQGIAGAGGLDPESRRLGQRTRATALSASGQYEPALAAYREALDATPAGRALERANTLASVAMLLETQARFADAEQAYREVIEVHTALLGEAHPDLARDYGNLGNALMLQRRFDEAELAQRHALTLELAVFGPDHPSNRGRPGEPGRDAGHVRSAGGGRARVSRGAGDHRGGPPPSRARPSQPRHPRARAGPLPRRRTRGPARARALRRDRRPRSPQRHRRPLGARRRPRRPGPPHRGRGRAPRGAGNRPRGPRRRPRSGRQGPPAPRLEPARARPPPRSHRATRGVAPPAGRTRRRGIPTLATTRFALARALWDAKRDRERARALATTALEEFGEGERGDAVRAWLLAHGGR